jgi:hypothetical protein
MTDRLVVIYCIGCGRVDTAQACPEACDEQALDLVFASDYDALANVADPFRGVRMLRDLVVRLVHSGPDQGERAAASHDGERAVAPRDSEAEHAFRALEAEARSVLREVNLHRRAQPRPAEEVERIATWHCPRCGRVEAPRDCLGICVRRPVEMVPAARYDEARAHYETARRQEEELSVVVRQLAWVTPRAGEWERTRRALQSRALAALAKI